MCRQAVSGVISGFCDHICTGGKGKVARYRVVTIKHDRISTIAKGNFAIVLIVSALNNYCLII